MKNTDFSYYDTTSYMREHYGHELLNYIDPDYANTRPWIENGIQWQFGLALAPLWVGSVQFWEEDEIPRHLEGAGIYSVVHNDQLLTPKQRRHMVTDLLATMALRQMKGEE